MSAPIEHSNHVDDARLYAPPWARERPLPTESQPPSLSSPSVAPAPGSTERTGPPRMPLGGPNIPWTPKPRGRPAFEGDVALVELRRRLSLQPDIVPDPPNWTRQERPTRWLMRLSFLFLLAAVAAYGLTMLSAFDWSARFAETEQPATVSLASAASTPEPRQTTPPHLIVEKRRAYANEPLPLGLSLNGATGDEFVLLKGLAAGTRLSAGTPLGPRSWRVPAREVSNLLAFAPKDYVGTMDAAIDLRSANDRVVDSHIIRLEWVAKSLAGHSDPGWPRAQTQPRAPVLLKIDPEEIAMLLRRGQEMLRLGDIAAARLMLRRAADAGNARAALLLGATFDPVVLREAGVMGFAPDASQARQWYRRAADLGSKEAETRFERLQQAARKE